MNLNKTAINLTTETESQLSKFFPINKNVNLIRNQKIRKEQIA